jgi:hypothetical protein
MKHKRVSTVWLESTEQRRISGSFTENAVEEEEAHELPEPPAIETREGSAYSSCQCEILLFPSYEDFCECLFVELGAT